MADFSPVSSRAATPPGGLRWRAPRPVAVDWLVAAVIGLLALAEELRGAGGVLEWPESAWWVGGALAAAFLVLVRRRFPLAVMCGFTAVTLGALVVAGQVPAAWQWYTQLLLLFNLLSVVPVGGPRGVAGLVMTGALLVGPAFVSPARPQEYAVAAVMALVAAGAGAVVRRRGPRAEPDAREAVAREAVVQEAVVQEAVARERARIARELHDIVAHSVSVMVMQAGGVRLTLPAERRREREALAVIEETGRGAVEELNRMLGLLRAPEHDETAPQPTLDRLAELVANLRAAGLDVALQVKGEPRPLPAGLGLSAYRIAQEALTNVLKHAGPTEALVTVTHGDTALGVEVVDEGPRDGRGGRPGTPASGNGMTGIRERVALFHGDLDAGPRAGGGYRLRAVLPLPVSAMSVRQGG